MAISMTELQEENANLRKALQKYVQLETDIENNLIYGVINRDTKEKCCKICYDNSGKIITLSKKSPGRFVCNVCNKVFDDPDNKEQANKDRQNDFEATARLLKAGIC